MLVVGLKKKKKKENQKQASSYPVCYFPHCSTGKQLDNVLSVFWKINHCHGEFLKTIWLLSEWKSPISKPPHFKKGQKTTNYLHDNFNIRRVHLKTLNLPIRIHPRLHISLTSPTDLGHSKHIWSSQFVKPMSISQSCCHCQKLSWFTHHWDNLFGQAELISLGVQCPFTLYEFARKLHPTWMLTEDTTKHCVHHHQEEPSLYWSTTHNYHTFPLCLKVVLSSKVVSSDNYIYRCHHAKCLASMRQGNGDISALSLRAKQNKTKQKKPE